MERKAKFAVTGMAAFAALGTFAGVGVASTADDDQALQGDTYTQAVEAATTEINGEVVETEAGDDGAAYEVEIRHADGQSVEVQLDDNFEVIGTETDDDGDDDDD